MRFSTLTTAVFAAGTFASPINKRDVVTDVVVDNVVVTDVIMTTVTVGQTPPSPVAQSPVPVVNVVVPTTSTSVVVQQPQQPPPTPSPSPIPVQSPVIAENKVVASPISSAKPSEVPSSTAAPSSSAAPLPSYTPSGGLPTTFVDNLDPSSSTYQQLALQHHNIHRANHSAPALVWNSTLTDYAKTTAETCVWGHNRYVKLTHLICCRCKRKVANPY